MQFPSGFIDSNVLVMTAFAQLVRHVNDLEQRFTMVTVGNPGADAKWPLPESASMCNADSY